MKYATELDDPNRIILEHMGAVLDVHYKRGWWYTQVKRFDTLDYNAIATTMSTSEAESYREALEHVESLMYGLVYNIEKQKAT